MRWVAAKAGDVLLDPAQSGLLVQSGTPLHPKLELTPLGWQIASLLRQHMASGAKVADFSFQTPSSRLKDV